MASSTLWSRWCLCRSKKFPKIINKKAIENLFLLVQPIMCSLGTEKYLGKLEEILNGSSGSSKQRKFYKNSKNFKYVIKALIEQFYQ